jgi:hypothetical protein
MKIVIRIRLPAVRLCGTEWVLCALLGVLGGGLRSTFSIRQAEEFFPLALLVCSSSRVDRPWAAISALVHVRDMLGRLVVTDDVLPCIALLAQDGVAVIVGEAANALDRRRLFIINRTV